MDNNKHLTDIIPVLSQTAQGLQSVAPLQYPINDLWDPLFNTKAREYIKQKYGSNSLWNTLQGLEEGTMGAWRNKDHSGLLGPTMGTLSFFGRTMDKAGDPLLGLLSEVTSGQDIQNPLKRIFVDDYDYTGKEALRNIINTVSGSTLTEKETTGLGWNLSGLGLEFATDPGIGGSIMSRIASKNNLGLLGDVGKLFSSYDDTMGKIALNALAPGSTFAANGFLKGLSRYNQALGPATAKNLNDFGVGMNAIPPDGGETFAKSFGEQANVLPEPDMTQAYTVQDDMITNILRAYTPEDAATNPQVAELVRNVDTIRGLRTPELPMKGRPTNALNGVGISNNPVMDQVAKQAVAGDTNQLLPDVEEFSKKITDSKAEMEAKSIKYMNDRAATGIPFNENTRIRNMNDGGYTDRDEILDIFSQKLKEGKIQDPESVILEIEDALGQDLPQYHMNDDALPDEGPSRIYETGQDREARLLRELETGNIEPAPTPIDVPAVHYRTSLDDLADDLTNRQLGNMSLYDGDTVHIKAAGQENDVLVSKVVSDILRKHMPIDDVAGGTVKVQINDWNNAKHFAHVKEYIDTFVDGFVKKHNIQDIDEFRTTVAHAFNPKIDSSPFQKEFYRHLEPFIQAAYAKKAKIFKHAGNTYAGYQASLKEFVEYVERNPLLFSGKMLAGESTGVFEDVQNMFDGVQRLYKEANDPGVLSSMSGWMNSFDSYEQAAIKQYGENIPEDILKAAKAKDVTAYNRILKENPWLEIVDAHGVHRYHKIGLQAADLNYANSKFSSLVKKKPAGTAKVVANVEQVLKSEVPVEQTFKQMAAGPIADVQSQIELDAIRKYYAIDPHGISPADAGKTISTFSNDTYFDRIHKSFVDARNVASWNKVPTLESASKKPWFAEIEQHDELRPQATKHVIHAEDIAQDYTTKSQDVLTDLVRSGYRKGTMCTTKAEADALETQLTNIVNTVNTYAKEDILHVRRVDDKTRTFVGILGNTNIDDFGFKMKNITQAHLKGKFDLGGDISWWRKADGVLPSTVPQADINAVYTSYNQAKREVQRINTELGHGDLVKETADHTLPYIHHTLDANEAGNHFLNMIWGDANLDDLDGYANGVANALNLNKTFRSVAPGRSFEGPISLYNVGPQRIFDDSNLTNIVKSSFSQGVMSNKNYQLHVSLFDNDNYKLQNLFPEGSGIDGLKKALFGTDSGNLDNLNIITPIYKDGALYRYKRYNKFNDIDLASAMADKDAILAPNFLFAPLDRLLKKDIIMSSKAYAFMNRYYTLPFKFGVLTNPGFVLGNISDAVFKSTLTDSVKYKEDFVRAFADYTKSMSDVIKINNSFSDIYDRYLVKIKQKIPQDALLSNVTLRKNFTEFMNSDQFTDAEKQVARTFFAINDVQNSVLFDINAITPVEKLKSVVSKSADELDSEAIKSLDVDVEVGKYAVPDSKVAKAFFGTHAPGPKGWGIFTNNPVFNTVMTSSNAIEHWVRSAHILSEMKMRHVMDPANPAFLDMARFASESKDLDVVILDAINKMNTAHFNYDNVPDALAGISTVIPFPTFFVKNMGYWMDMVVNHPQVVENLIDTQNALWEDKKEQTARDSQVAAAKGRGALPTAAGYYKPTPTASMYGAFDSLTNPVQSVAYRLNPLAHMLTQAAMDNKDVKYRPYNDNPNQRNEVKGKPGFSLMNYSLHQLNPFEKQFQNLPRLPSKLANGQAQPADVLPSIFQPMFNQTDDWRKRATPLPPGQDNRPQPSYPPNKYPQKKP